VTLDNIGALRRAAAVLTRLGLRPTYFTAYQVAADPRAADVMREVSAGGRAEIGGHLHPWNTPPLSEPFLPRNSMLHNLPAQLQLAKLRSLTDRLEQTFGSRPTAFRAGRYGLGGETVGPLLECGYRVDSSVSPFIDLRSTDEGPTFVGAPMNAYRLAPGRDVRDPAPDGGLVEIPLSYGFSRGPFRFWDPIRRALEAAPLRWLHLAGVAARAGLLKRLTLSPELATAADMLTLSHRLLEQGVRHLHLTWHSPTLRPGLSPYADSEADVDRLYAALSDYMEGLSQITPFRCVTVSEAAALLG
jgi:hypothetical protein